VRIQDEWFERYLALLTPRGRVTQARALQIATVGGALVGTTTMLTALWATSQPRANIVDMTAAALDQLDPIWPSWLGGQHPGDATRLAADAIG
jgi:hypothetical protein